MPLSVSFSKAKMACYSFGTRYYQFSKFNPIFIKVPTKVILNCHLLQNLPENCVMLVTLRKFDERNFRNLRKMPKFVFLQCNIKYFAKKNCIIGHGLSQKKIHFNPVFWKEIKKKTIFTVCLVAHGEVQNWTQQPNFRQKKYFSEFIVSFKINVHILLYSLKWLKKTYFIQKHVLYT